MKLSRLLVLAIVLMGLVHGSLARAQQTTIEQMEQRVEQKRKEKEARERAQKKLPSASRRPVPTANTLLTKAMECCTSAR